MSAFPDYELPLPIAGRAKLSRVQFAALATAISIVGLSIVWPTVLALWTLWMTDALKSIGMVIPFVSVALILRVWRRLGWEAQGTWWGLVLLVVTAIAVRLRDQAALVLIVSPKWAVFFPPLSLVIFAYASGAVLLFGGTRLYRAALFPIVLTWFVNPIPHVFNLWVDLPLQHASAHIARAFAMHLGHQLTPDHLRLMFTPDFGMFIAPGCNGIRGSITMGFIALIAGYLYRFRWYATALVVLGAVTLGYVFNLARLCVLVLYYEVALHYPSLQNKAENADYVIGGVLFLIATLLLFSVIQRLRDAAEKRGDSPEALDEAPTSDEAASMRYARLATMSVLAMLGWCGLIAGHAAVLPTLNSVQDAEALKSFPAELGKYRLARTWNETMVGGSVVYVWAEYAPVGGGAPVAVGVSPVLGSHDPLICHTARGDDPIWQGQMSIPTGADSPVSFSSAFFNDGVTRHLEASTLCSGNSCGEFATARTHFGFVYSRPGAMSLMSGTGRPIPVLLRIESSDASGSNDAVRDELTSELKDFLAPVRLDNLTRPYYSSK